MNSLLRLLLLEDNPADADLYERVMDKAGIAFTALRVDTPESFIAALDEFKPDIVLADYDLAGFEGLRALTLARDKSPDTPCIIVSGAMGDELAADSIKHGAADFVAKDRLSRLPVAVLKALEEMKLRAQHRAALEALREQTLFLSSLLESMPVPVFYKDSHGRYLGCNQAFEEIIGKSRSEIVGKSVFDMASPEIAGKYHAMDEELFRKPGRQMYEWVIQKPSGETRSVLFHKASFLHGDGSVGGLIGALVDITERKQMEEQVQQLAFFDPLTKLPNRRLLNDRLSRVLAASKRNDRYGALMFLDLDNFKSLNDTHGHVVGDLLLIEAARRLKTCVREMDTVARFGGDEFVVLLGELGADGTASNAQAHLIAEKIRIALSEPYQLTIRNAREADTTVEHHCTTSIGVVVFINHEGNQDDILKLADAVMYQAKEGGRNQVRFYEPHISD